MLVKLRGQGRKKDKSAASEIIGNILILGITVTLFTGVFAFVNDIPAPPEPLQVEFGSELIGDVLYIYHRGGSDLRTEDLHIQISANHKTAAFLVGDGQLASASSQTWRPGDTWSLDLDENAWKFPLDGSPLSITSLSISVSHSTLVQPLWTHVLLSDSNLPVKIRNFKTLDVDGRPKQVDLGNGNVWVIDLRDDGFGLWVEVDEPSGVKVQQVWADLSSIGASNHAALSLTGGEIYVYSSGTAPSSDVGLYEIRIYLQDNLGKIGYETRYVQLWKGSVDPSNPPVTPEEPEEYPLDQGTSNPEMVNDLYFLTPQQWAEFVASGGTVNVHDTFTVSGNSIVMAFKNSAITDMPDDMDWGGDTAGSPHLIVSISSAFYAQRGEPSYNREFNAEVYVEKLEIGEVLWNYYTIILEDSDLAILERGLFIEAKVKFREEGKELKDTVVRATAYGSFHRPENEHVKVQTFHPGGPPKGVLSIGDDVIISITLPFASDDYLSVGDPKFRISSFHTERSQEVITTRIDSVGNVINFHMESFEAVGIYLSNSSFFIRSNPLPFKLGNDNYYARVAAKLYLTEDYVVNPGESIQDVINGANSGDTIRVFSGVFNERLYFEGKSLLIYGNATKGFTSSEIRPPNPTNPDDRYGVKFVDSIGVEFRGFSINALQSEFSVGSFNSRVTIKNVRTSAPSDIDSSTYRFMNSAYSEISNCTLNQDRNVRHQISIQDSEGVVISNNKGIIPSTRADAVTVEIRNSPNSYFVSNSITDKRASNAKHHLSIQESPGAIVEGNDILSTQADSSATVEIRNSPDSQFNNNKINSNLAIVENARHQLSVQNSARGTFNNNEIDSCRLPGSITVEFYESPDAKFHDNKILNRITNDAEGPLHQLRVHGSADSTIIGNDIASATLSGSTAVIITWSEGARFSSNEIDGDPTPSINNQLRVENCYKVTVTDNEFRMKPNGKKQTVHIRDSGDCYVIGNKLFNPNANDDQDEFITFVRSDQRPSL